MHTKLLLLTLVSTSLISGSVTAQSDTTDQKREVFTKEDRSRGGLEQGIRRATGHFEQSIDNSSEHFDRGVDRVADNIERASESIVKSSKRVVFYSPKSTSSNKNENRSRNRNRTAGVNKGHWAGITLSYNGLISGLGDFSLPDDGEFLSQAPKSIGITINPIDVFIPFNKNFGLVTGLGFEFNNFRFSKNMTLLNTNGVIGPDYKYDASGITLSKSKLSTYYMNIPLLFEYKTAGRKEFFINTGVVGGWRMGAHTKIKAQDPQLRGKFKNHGDLGLKNFHYGYTFNIGYENVALSTTYYPGSIFRKGKGPDVEQVNIGISLLW